MNHCKYSCPMELVYTNEVLKLVVYICKKCGKIARYTEDKLTLIDYDDIICTDKAILNQDKN